MRMKLFWKNKAKWMKITPNRMKISKTSNNKDAKKV